MTGGALPPAGGLGRPGWACIYAPVVLPPVVQVPEYTRALHGGGADAAALAAGHEAALAWRELLGSLGGNLRVLLTEACLMWRWGPPGDCREQAEYLAGLARRPGVVLRLQRFRDGPPAVLDPVTILGWGDGRRLVIGAAGRTGDPEVAGSCLESFDAACEAALEPGDTSVFLGQYATRIGAAP